MSSHDPGTVFSSRHLADELNPAKFRFRESCDSPVNPESTPILWGLDVTASMRRIPQYMIQTGYPALVPLIYERGVVTDPHLGFAAIGDVNYGRGSGDGDQAPLQVTQFEAQAEPALKQMEKIWLEGGGGGNMYESYGLLHFWAAMCTKIDCYTKRGKKGILITVGDERPMPSLSKADIERVLGPDHGLELQAEYSARQLLDMAQKKWDVYHFVIHEGSNYEHETTDELWKDLLGEKAIPVKDHTKIAEIAISVLEVAGGRDQETVAKSWDGSTGVVVREAVKGLTVGGGAKVAQGVATL
jgi:hypothetical protein